MITADLRRAIAAAAEAAGLGNPDPGLRPTGLPGQYAASIALAAPNPYATAEALAASLRREPWIATVDITGPGYLSVTVTDEALAAVPGRITAAGPACASSDALAGTAVPAPPPGAPLTAPTWEKARTALAVQLTARLAAAAGATIAPNEAARLPPTLPVHQRLWEAQETLVPKTVVPKTVVPKTVVTDAVAFAGPDAVTFTLARAIPGKPLRVDPVEIARRVPGNPAYAVRYAHARAASGVRWAAFSRGAVFSRGGDPPYPPVSRRPGPMAKTAIVSDPSAATAGAVVSGPSAATVGEEELRLLDLLSWLPERVAMAARRGRPDEFARYLEDLASVTIDVLTSAPRPPGRAGPPGSGKLALAEAARTALAAGLGLLGVGAPARL